MIGTFQMRLDLRNRKPSRFELALSIKLSLIEIVRRLGIAAFPKYEDGTRVYFGRELDNADEGMTKPSVSVFLTLYVCVVGLKIKHHSELK